MAQRESAVKTTIVIPAAGQGTRLRPLTDDIPKCMVAVHGKPLLHWQLAVQADVDAEVVVVCGYRPDRIDAPGAILRDNPDYYSTNMVRTLMCAEGDFGDHLVISYGDIIYETPLLRGLIDCPDEIAVVVDKDWLPYWRQRFEDPLSDAETLRLDSGRITEIGGKPDSVDDIQGQFIGLVGFRSRGLEWMRQVIAEAQQLQSKGETLPGCPRNLDGLYTTDLLQELIRRGHPVTPVFSDGGWLEVDSVSDLELAENLSTSREGQLRILR